jgi:pilus assembly protein CpaF
MFNLIVYRDEEVFLETDVVHVETTIGKGSECHIELKGWSISKNHASLVINDDDIFVQDEGSMFGTYVNNERIKRYGPLTNADVITVGNYTLSVVKTGAYGEQERNGSTRASVTGESGSLDWLQDSRATKHAVAVETAQEVAVAERAAVPSTAQFDVAMERQEPVKRVAVPEAVPGNAAFERSSPAVPAAVPRPPAERVAMPAMPSGGTTSAAVAEPEHRQPVRCRSETNQEFDKWRRFVHEAVLHEMDIRRVDANRMKDDELRANVRLIIREVIQASKDLPKEVDQKELARQVLDEAVGLGPLEPLLADDDVTEIMVNRHDEIWVEKKGQLFLSEATFSTDNAVLGAIERIVSPLGRRIDESSPMVDARLKDGSRVNAIISPLSLRGPSLTIRKFSKKKITAQDYINYGSLTQEMVDLLITIVELRLNVIISGGTGTGKTSFLNMISSYVEDSERIVTIEDAAELKLPQPNLVSLESRPPNLEGKGAIAIRDLVRNSLRMRPDRIIVGECRGGEALDMLQAMNTGHDGSMTTLHSNSPRDALARLEVLVLMAGMNLPVRAIREQIASAVQVIVQLTRFSCGARKITSISEIVGMEGEVIQTNEIFKYRKTGRDEQGRTVGVFEYSGIKPDFMKRLDS